MFEYLINYFRGIEGLTDELARERNKSADLKHKLRMVGGEYDKTCRELAEANNRTERLSDLHISTTKERDAALLQIAELTRHLHGAKEGV